jgi:hypothetical protein
MDKFLTGVIVTLIVAILFELVFGLWFFGLVWGSLLGLVVAQFDNFMELLCLIKDGLTKSKE